jgi:hypothetical protein
METYKEMEYRKERTDKKEEDRKNLLDRIVRGAVAPGLLAETVVRLRLRLPPPASQLAHILYMSG